MLLWNNLHAYNAVHCVEVPSTLDLVRLHDVISWTIEACDLTGLSIDGDAGTYQYEGGCFAGHITDITSEQNTLASLADEIRKQLNTTFVPEERMEPFRFFVQTSGASFYLGVAYFHAMAGAESIVLLMHDIVNAYLGRDKKVLSKPLDVYPPTYGGWLRRHPGVLIRKLINLPFRFWKLNHSWRPRYKDEMDVDNGFILFSLSAAQLKMLLGASKSWGVTLNDLFLAVLLKVFEPLKDHRAYSRKRRQFSLGTIVNIRKDMVVDSHRSFGLFLGSFVITHKVPEGISLSSLVKDVHDQTTVIKRARSYMGSPIDLAMAQRSLRFLSMERKKKFYQKHYPLWGGITNMNLNTIWPQTGESDQVNYIRAVSTGPATPLVMSITTVRDIVNIGVSYRSTVFTTTDMEFIKSRFLKLVQQTGNDQ
jgi:hypothetical protein